MTKTILDLINRIPAPAPWSEGDNIPWNEPAFSERMLSEHLSQAHDLASRKSATIDLFVDWIFAALLDARPGRVLDLCCGPGLFTSRLARRGCECVGIDFSPASIRYATETAAKEALSCTYHHADVRDGQLGRGFDLAMMIYGQFNVFERHRGLEILKSAHGALRPGGRIALEIQTEAQIKADGQRPATWNTAQEGLFSAEPHLFLQENFWNGDARASVMRFSVIDGRTGQVSSYSLTTEAYTEPELTGAVESAGFTGAKWFPSLIGTEISKDKDMPVIVAVK